MAAEPVLQRVGAVRGVRPELFVDDSFVSEPASRMAATRRCVDDSFAAGALPINVVKSTDPATRKTYIGWVWDTATNRQSLPPGKLAELRVAMAIVRDARRLSRAALERLLGALQFAAEGARHLSAFLSELQYLKDSTGSAPFIKLSPAARHDIELWHAFLERFQGSAIIVLPTPTATLFTDACTSWGWGWYAPELGVFGCGAWSERVRALDLHINALELLAAIIAIVGVRGAAAPGSHVHLFVDNTSAIASIKKRRGKHGVLARLTRSLCFLLETERTSPSDTLPPTATHVQGVANTVADSLSRGGTHACLQGFTQITCTDSWIDYMAASEMPWHSLLL